MGKLIEKGNAINDKDKDGEWFKYDKNGKIVRKQNYQAGVRIEEIYYYPDGKIAIKQSNIDGKGVEEKYYPNGNISENFTGTDKNNYDKITYYETGKLKSNAKVTDGSGEEIKYDENGVVIGTTVFENGTNISEQQKWRAKVIADSIAYASQLQFNNSQNSNASNEEVFSVVEEMPEFVGGEQGKMIFIQQKLQYPQSAKNAGITGTCYVKFIVASNGTLKDIQLLKGISGCKECGDEAIRVIKSMPNWKPGKQNGKAVSVSMNQAVKFQ